MNRPAFLPQRSTKYSGWISAAVATWLPLMAAHAQTTPEPDAETKPASSAGPSLSGHVQAGYHAELLGSGGQREQLAPLVQYTPAGNNFVLHAAHVALTQHLGESVLATIELDAGYDASKTSSYPFQNSFFDVQEAYASYVRGPFTLTAGKFTSYMGIEYIEGPLNANVTRGYSYNLAEPNTHTGVKLHYAHGALDLGLGVVNGWDTLVDNNGDKTIIWRFALTPSESFTINLNGTFGSETENDSSSKRLSLDLDGEWALSERWVLRFQANMGWDGIGGAPGIVRWYVCGLQPLYTGEVFTFGARAELFGDPDGARARLGNTRLINIALTPGVILTQSLRARLEARTDYATRRVFGKESALRHALVSLAVSAEYTF